MVVIAAVAALYWVADRIPWGGGTTCSEFENTYWYGPKGYGDEERLSPQHCDIAPKRCGQTGLLFNGEGRHAFYYRSQCYFRLAEKTRREEYCQEVKEYRSLLGDGSYYTPANCLAEVRKLRHGDVAYAAGTKRLTDLQLDIDEQKVFAKVGLSTADRSGIYYFTLSVKFYPADASSTSLSCKYLDPRNQLELPSDTKNASLEAAAEFITEQGPNAGLLHLSKDQKWLIVPIIDPQLAAAVLTNQVISLKAQMYFKESATLAADATRSDIHWSEKTLELTPHKPPYRFPSCNRSAI